MKMAHSSLTRMENSSGKLNGSLIWLIWLQYWVCVSKGQGLTPGNSWCVCAPGHSPNSDSVSDQCHYSNPFSDLASNKHCQHYLDYNSKKKTKILKIHSNLHTILVIWNCSGKYIHSLWFPQKPYRIPGQNRQRLNPLRPKCWKNHTLWAGT